MKGSTAASILKTLKKKRFESIMAQLGTEPNGEIMVKICQSLRRSDEFSEAELLFDLNLSKGQYYHWLQALGTQLVLLMAGKSEALQMQGLYQLARDLVFASEFEAAADLIRVGIRQASQVEDFNLVLDFWDLVEPIIPRPKIDGMDAGTSRRLRNNLNQFGDLWAEVEKLGDETLPNVRKAKIHSILKCDLLKDESKALSKKAQQLYLKLKASCLIHLRLYSDAIPFQKALMDHVKANEWIFADHEYVSAKETKTMIQLLRLTKQEEPLRSLSAYFENLSFKSPRAEQERAFLRYPTSLAVAIEFGDASLGARLATSFLDLVATRQCKFDNQFITENLYYCGYIMLASADQESLGKILKHLRSFGKPDFKPRYYTLSKLLEVLFNVECKDWEEAIRLIKNLRAGSGIVELPGLKETLRYLSQISLASLTTKQLTADFHTSRDLEALTTALRGHDLLDYFDFMAWVEAKEHGGSMMEIFRRRASHRSE